MLERIVPVVTCLLFGAHVALGCVAHHAHSSHCEPRVQAVEHHRAEGHHAHGHESSSCSHAPQRSGDRSLPDECCENQSCQYTRTDVVALDYEVTCRPHFHGGPAWSLATVEVASSIDVVQVVDARFSAGPDLYVWYCALVL